MCIYYSRNLFVIIMHIFLRYVLFFIPAIVNETTTSPFRKIPRMIPKVQASRTIKASGNTPPGHYCIALFVNKWVKWVFLPTVYLSLILKLMSFSVKHNS